MPRIYAALENCQADHETSMVEIEDMINNQPISILIDLGTSLSYISPKVVYLCNLVPEKFDKLWLVQLAIGTKRKVTSIVRNCKIMLHNLLMHVNVNIFPLGSYDMLVVMDWIEEHKVCLNYFDKTFTCIENNGNIIKVKGIPRKVTIREIYALQMKRSIRKGCNVFVVYIMNDRENDIKPKLEEIPILKEFEGIFSEEVHGIPPKRDIYFIIDLIPGVVLASKAPYRMNIIELIEIKSHLQELIDKRYIRPSVSPKRAPVLL